MASGLPRSIVIPGRPMTWARAQARLRKGQPVFYTPDSRRRRMAEIAVFWADAGHGQFPSPTPLELRCEFVFDRPRSHYGTGRNSSEVKAAMRASRPGRGKNGGDLDNLLKLVLDSLNGVAYDDDSQIALMHAEKRYATPGEAPETRVSLRVLGEK